MPTFQRSAFVLAVLALMGACGHTTTQADVETRTLSSTDGRTCRGYFTWHGPVDHVVFAMNGTGTKSNAFLPPALEGIVPERAVLFATLDRPGITATFGAPENASTDQALLEGVTQTQLLACAKNAVHWIAERFGSTLHIHLRGHSEGALLSLMLYRDLLTREPALAARIETLILTGTPLEPFRTIVESQLAVFDEHDGGALRAAVSQCDWPSMRDKLGVSCAYLDDAYAQPSGRDLFQDLAEAHAPAQFYLFHGTQDWNARVEPVHALEDWVQTQPLTVHFTYYEGGHNDPPPATRQALIMLLNTLTQP